MASLTGLRVSGAPGPFTLGVTEPVGGGNVGAGVLRAYPADIITVDGPVSLSGSVYTIAAGATVVDRIIPGFVNLGDGATLENCAVTGPTSEVATVRAMVQGPTTGLAEVRFCTIEPQVASAYQDGVGPRNLLVDRSWITGVTDGARAFNTAGGPINLELRASLIEFMAQFAPDVPNSRTETHNDGIQVQGTAATVADDDVLIDGCKINARHSTTKGNIPPYRDQISALMMTSNVGQMRVAVRDSWLLGGIYCINAGSDGLTSATHLTVTGTRFERPGTDALAPDVALAVDASVTLTHSGNTYIDNGATVPVTSA